MLRRKLISFYNRVVAARHYGENIPGGVSDYLELDDDFDEIMGKIHQLYGEEFPEENLSDHVRIPCLKRKKVKGFT